MGYDRLHHLAVLSVEKQELCELSHSQAIDHFATMKNRWYSVMLIHGLDSVLT